jgi:hypothetical protein
MGTAKYHSLLRNLVILTSGFFLLESFVYGAGRGMSSIPAGYEGLAILKVATYAAILIGALSLPRRLNLAVLFLALGIAGRSFLELRTSVARSWFDSGSGFDTTRALLVALMYVATFMLPALLLFDTIRLVRRPRVNIPTNTTGEQGAADQLPARCESKA